MGFNNPAINGGVRTINSIGTGTLVPFKFIVEFMIYSYYL